MTAAAGLRRGLFALAALGVLGTLVELAILRHWDNLSELIPWVFLTAAGALVVATFRKPSRKTILWARWVGLAVGAAGVYGLIIHIAANMSAAPLDASVGPLWDSLPIWHQLWLASTGGAGPAPPLSAASVAPTGLALSLATYRHEALAGNPIH